MRSMACLFAAAGLLALALSVQGNSFAAGDGDGAGAINQQVVSEQRFPKALSDYGFFDGSPDRPNPALIAYNVRNPLFSDYADKMRFIHLPKGAMVSADDQGRLQFPVGTALIKNFAYPAKDGTHDTLETRLLLHRKDGWLALPYVWNADRSDAALKVAGKRIPVSFTAPSGEAHNISYAVPNKNQCKQCHSRDDALAPIGPVWQDMEFAKDGDRQMLTKGIANPDQWQAAVKWDDVNADLNLRAQSYLAANCAHCHSKTGSASNSGLFYDEPLALNAASGYRKRPVAAGRGSAGLDFVVDPGRPDQSIVVHRMKSLDPGVAMPEIGRATYHKEGVQLIEDWISAMDADAP